MQLFGRRAILPDEATLHRIRSAARAAHQECGDEQDYGAAEKCGPCLEAAPRRQLVDRGESKRGRGLPEIEREGIHRDRDAFDQAHSGLRSGDRGPGGGVRQGNQRGEAGGETEQEEREPFRHDRPHANRPQHRPSTTTRNHRGGGEQDHAAAEKFG